MAVALLPYGHPQKQLSRLARQPLAGMSWFGAPPAQAQNVGDLSADDHLLMMVSSRALTANLRHVRCAVSTLLLEPPAVQQRYYRVLSLVGSRYHRIFTYSDHLIHRLQNATHLPHGGASIAPPPADAMAKIALVSLVASRKRTTAGHRLRHRVADWSRSSQTPLDLFGRGYRPVESVTTALAPYRYSVVIENSRFPGYFTEKLIDCLLCRTVPIYWGDPNILSHFEPAGIINCQSEAELYESIAACSEQDYQDRLSAIKDNNKRANYYGQSPLLRAANELMGPQAPGAKILALTDAREAV